MNWKCRKTHMFIKPLKKFKWNGKKTRVAHSNIVRISIRCFSLGCSLNGFVTIRFSDENTKFDFFNTRFSLEAWHKILATSYREKRKRTITHNEMLCWRRKIYIELYKFRCFSSFFLFFFSSLFKEFHHSWRILM